MTPKLSVMMDPKFAGKPITAQYSLTGRTDLDQMTDTPTRGAHHRRAQSETFFRIPDFDDDDIILDDVVADFNLDFPPAPSLSSSSSDNHMQQQKPNGPAQFKRLSDEPKPVGHLAHYRSLSVDADFFAGLDFGAAAAAPPVEQTVVSGGPRHRHSNSMDGSFSATSFEAVDSSKKAMAPDKLAELALIDPKRAKRILANRQSAARSKERKIRYTGELERKVQTLQTEATTLSAEVTKLQRDTTGLTTENKELKLRLQALEEQAHLRDALNEALREELQRLKIAAGQIQAVNGNNTGFRPQFSSQPQTFNNFSVPHPQFPQQQPHQQLNIPHSTAGNTNLSGQPQPSFRGFNQRV